MIKYVLISPARNEETFIEMTIRSVISQTHRPERWVIVDDGSTDRTAEIVKGYQEQHPWIELLRRPEHLDRSFAGKVHAFNAGREKVEGLECEVIGNLDADLSFEPDYMEFLMKKFAEDPGLGVAGTPFTQDGGYDTAKDSFEGQNYVAGGCQLFRARCFDEIGGYTPNAAGGVDWIAVMSARMKGWNVTAFQEKRFHHYRPLGTAENRPLHAIFNYGERAYYLGSSPVWHLFRVAFRMTKKPYVVGGISLLLGYCWSAINRVRRPVTPEMMRYYRNDQMHKLKAIFRSLLATRKVDAFSLPTKSHGARQGDSK